MRVYGEKERLEVKIGEEFKPSPQFKKLYYIYLLFAILFAILWWYIPVLLFTPFEVKVGITIPVLAILIFVAYWIPKYYETIVYRLTKDEIECKRGVWFRKIGIVPYNRITNIDVVQGPISRMLGIASLEIQTAGYSVSPTRGTPSAEIRIEGVEQFEELKELIMEFVRSKKPVAVEAYGEANIGLKILSELVEIRKLLEKSLEK